MSGARAVSLALMLAAVSFTACSGVEEDPTLTTSEEALSGSERPAAPEMVGRLPDLVGPKSPASREAHACDSTPDVVTVQLCGEEIPSSTHFEWTDCQGPQRPPPGAMDGGFRPPPEGMLGGGDGGVCPPPHDHGTSTGTLDIETTVTLVSGTECAADAVYQFLTTATYSITRSGERGSETLTGTSASSTDRTLAAEQFTSTHSINSQSVRTRQDGSTDTHNVVGTLTVAVDKSAASPSRTESGTINITGSRGNASATLTSVKRVPPDQCRFPVSGQSDLVDPDGTAHVIVFGPDCGAATVDGVATQLNDRGPGGRRPGDGPPPPRQ